MSRIGRLPISVLAGVEVKVDGNLVTVKCSESGYESDHAASEKHARRSGAMVIGVTNGYEKKLEIVGTGYRVTAKGNDLEFALGYSHPRPTSCLSIPEMVSLLAPSTAKETPSAGENVRRKVGKAGK